MTVAIELRRARASDAATVYRWRNHEDVRIRSANPTPISVDEHSAWFARVLVDPTRHLLIASVQGDDVGVLRFDEKAPGNIAEMSIYVAPELTGRGIGTAMIEAGVTWVREHTTIELVRARVKVSNLPSRRAFEKAAFEPVMLELERRTR